MIKECLQKKKNDVDRETVPIPSYPPTIETVSEYLDREYWSVFLPPLPTNVIGRLGKNIGSGKQHFFPMGVSKKITFCS